MLTRLLLAASGTVVALSVMPTAAEALSSGCGLTNGSFADSSWLACATTPDLVARVPSRSGIPTASEGALEGATAGGSAQASLSSQTRCTYGNTDTVDGTAAPAPRAGAGRWVFVYCGDAVTTGGWTWTAAAVVYPSPAQLARQAYARLTPVVDTPDYNPRHRSGKADATVVGFTTWLWLDGPSPSAKSVSATAGPNSATVTARPQVVSFDPGDGSAPVVCADGGRAYDPADPDSISTCVHRYLRASTSTPGGVFQLTVRVTFTATWTGTNGAGGVLPALTVTAAVPVMVDELQALNQ